ncbi:ATP-binding protein [Limoniibacter endophyticus]|uniref:histidine kinase n=1 Tax=Limoniibacter endophyticus TaxID=1565040 RepID=A0A8J3DIA2_9HYPH|nr:ATP-binding protein [Limoniibacter endophyticus]GHC74353.1 hypothetical protein GCM10010136_23480 [Limoniibacter endophyticus]
MRSISRGITVAYRLCATIFLVFVALVAHHVSRDEFDARYNTRQDNLVTIVKAFAAHSRRILATVDVLTKTAAQHADSGDDPAAVEALLITYAKALPMLQSIFVVNASGEIVVAKGSDWEGPALEPHPFSFLWLRETFEEEISVGPVEKHNSSGGDVFFMDFIYRPRTGAVGQHSVIIKVNMEVFQGFHNGLGGESNAEVSLVGEDNVIRAAAAAPGDMKESAIISIARRGVADTMKQVVEEPLAPYPLKISAHQSIQDLEQIFKLQMMWLGGILFLLLCGIGVGDVFLRNHLARRLKLLDLHNAREQEHRDKIFLQNILETSSVLIAATNNVGEVVVTNAQFRTLFNSLYHVVDLIDFLTTLGISQSVEHVSLPITEQAHIMDQQGKARHISWTVTSLRSPEGVVSHYIAVGFDLTELKEREFALRQSEKLVTLGEMATGLAHEINQPLGAMTLAVENVRSRLQEGVTAVEFIDSSLDLIAQQLERASTIVKHMRVFGRRTDGKVEPIHASSIIQGALLFLRNQLVLDEINVRCVLSHPEPKLLANQTLAEQIVLNLLVNARDAIVTYASRAHPSSIVVSAELSLDRQTVLISVADDGPGVPVHIRTRMFEPFFSTKATGQGMGLGLSMSYGMAKEMNGSLSYCETDHGGKFLLILPAA